MNEEKKRILEMLANGKINVDEATQLLDAVSGLQTGNDGLPSVKPKFLRVMVNDGEDNVNIRVPLQIIRAGMKLSALLPREAGEKLNASLAEKGIDLDLGSIKPEMIEELIDGIGQLSIDVNEGSGETVRIFCE